MIFVSIDSIVKSVLLDKRYPMHWYLEYLSYGCEIASELILDDLGIINTTILTLDEFGAAKLPDDYVDWTKVGVGVGQYIRPLVERDTISRLPNLDSTGKQIAYNTFNSNTVQGYLPNAYYKNVSINGYGEYIGREFGTPNIDYYDNYKIIKERGIIQCSEYLKGQKIVMEYISNGCCVIGTIGVEPYAKMTIKRYIEYMAEKNKRNNPDYVIERAKREYERNRKLLRARKSPLTPELINRIFIENFHSAPHI